MSHLLPVGKGLCLAAVVLLLGQLRLIRIPRLYTLAVWQDKQHFLGGRLAVRKLKGLRAGGQQVVRTCELC
jgi:hypothetical protein